jgi:hypothetical protein
MEDVLHHELDIFEKNGNYLDKQYIVKNKNNNLTLYII